MEHDQMNRHILTMGLLILATGSLGVSGCPPVNRTTPGIDIPPAIESTAATGTLILGQASTITVTATVTDVDGTVVAVTADLSSVGGSVSQALTLTRNNIWAFTGTVLPGTPGQQSIPMLAVDNSGQSAQATATITVGTSAASRIPPQIINVAVAGTLTVSQSSQFAVSATVVAVNGTVGAVTADLSAIGSLPAAPLTLTTGNVWTFSSVVVPPAAGTQTITITASDSLGNVATADTNVIVNTGFTVP